jgi:hypothetical protein
LLLRPGSTAAIDKLIGIFGLRIPEALKRMSVPSGSKGRA